MASESISARAGVAVGTATVGAGVDVGIGVAVGLSGVDEGRMAVSVATGLGVEVAVIVGLGVGVNLSADVEVLAGVIAVAIEATSTRVWLTAGAQPTSNPTQGKITSRCFFIDHPPRWLNILSVAKKLVKQFSTLRGANRQQLERLFGLVRPQMSGQ